MAVTNLPRVPEGLRDLVKTYTKEVLREKPKDLYKFSVDYFENLAGARKIHRKVIKYESQQSYETIMKNRIRQQLPLSLAFHIIPENLTEVIKQFIKAVLRENPQYLILFAIEYFKNLQASSSKLADIKYTAYEKFIEKTESKSPARKVTKCECGRILSSTPGLIQIEQNNSTDGRPQSEMHNKNDQYIKAVVIIQKYFRQYQIKQKAEKSSQVKIASKSVYSYDSQEVLNAILLIQRQFRRLLLKNRSKEKKHVNIDSYSSVKYMKAALVIQRFMRNYLRKKKSMQQKLPKPKDSTSDNISMTTAAFVIQKAFRRMVRARRAKRHINADLDQCDEMNDNVSEAASYTSASTALLSTESAGEHDFGSTNYEEGVHQQTIREDEEVENDNTNRKMIFGAESIKTNKTSIDPNEEGKPNNEHINETQLSETGDEPIDKHLRRGNSDELEKLITDDDISKDLQAEKTNNNNNINVENQPVNKSTTQDNVKTEDSLITPNSKVECSFDAKSNDGNSNSIPIQENANLTSQSNTYILKPEHLNNKILSSTENLVLERTAEQVKQSPTTSTAIVGSNNGNVLTGRESDIIDDSNRNEIQVEQPAEKDLIKTVELEKSSAMESGSLTDDNERILESAQTIEIEDAEDHSLKASKNIIANESSSKIHINMESLPQSENVLSSSSEGEVSTTTTDLKAPPEKEKLSSLSKFVISPKHSSLNIMNMKVDNYPNESSETTNSADLESELAAKQNHTILNALKSIDCDNENIVKATITDHSIGNTPKNNQLEEIVIENINKLTSDNDVSESSHTGKVNDNIHSDSTIENNVNESEQNEEIKVVSSNIMTEESSNKASSQETLEETESIKTPESLIVVSPTDKQFSEKSAKNSEDEPNLISLVKDTFEAESAKNTMINISNALLDQNASAETRCTPNLECANYDIINQNPKMSSSDCDNESPVNATTSEKDEGCNTKIKDGEDRNKPISSNKATPDIQYSIEVNSLQTVLKNLHNQPKDAHDDVLSENNTSSSEKGDTLSNTDINEKLFDDLGTSIIIHSVLPTEDDYELTILPPQNNIPLDTPDGTQLDESITESSDLNINEYQSITESNTSAEDLTVIETQKNSEINDDTNKPPNQPVDDVSEASSKMEILEETKILQNNELPALNTEEETTYVQITIHDNSETKEVPKLTDLSVKSHPLPKKDIDPPTSQKDSNECEEIDANRIQVVQKESKEEIDYGIEIEEKQPITLEEPIGMDNGQTKNKNGSTDTNSLVPSEKDSITNIAPNVGNTSENTISNLLNGDCKQVAAIDATAPSEEEFKINDLEPLKLELDPIHHNKDDTNKNENIKTSAILDHHIIEDNTTDSEAMKVIPNEASDGSKSDDPISENKSSLPLSNQLIGPQISKTTSHKIKKNTSVKDKQLSNHPSNRLVQTPIAELQLKSFKNQSDEGSWYEVYSEPNELNMNTNESKNANGSDEHNAALEEMKSSQILERSPSYINGDQIENNEPVKPKQSIAYFISFDGNDEKTSFKIPIKFLRRSEYRTSKSKTECHRSNTSQEEGKFVDSAADVSLCYQDFVIPKLQTIHELNENEVASEFRVDTDETTRNEQTGLRKENITSRIENETLCASPDISLLNLSKPAELKGQNLSSATDKIHLIKSANLIKRAYKAYKVRKYREQDKKGSETTDNEMLNDSKSKLEQVYAAIKIQKSFRKYLSKRAAQTKSQTAGQERQKYTVSEIVAAIKIQNTFRDYIRRKKVSKPEWFVGTQPISLLSSASSVSAVPDSLVASTGDKRVSPTPEWDHNTLIELNNLDAQSNGSLELATDIDNLVNELYATKVFETDNGASNNLAGLANEEGFDFAKDVGVLKNSEIEGVSQEDATMRELIYKFLEQEIKFSSHTDMQEHNMGIDEVHEPECVKRTLSLFSLDEDKSDNDELENRKENKIQHPNESESDLDTLDSAALKLLKTDQIIEKMSRRRSSEIREKEEKDDCNIRDPAFDEPIIQPMSALQNQNSIDIEDGDIVYKRLQRDETRESSAQSESVIFGNADEEKAIANDLEIVRSQLSRHYTIAGDDPKTIFKSVIINDSIKYIDDQNENGNENENEHAIDVSKGSNSFCLDDETSENIRKKMMAYSISEADSDYCDPNKIVKDDFHIDTAMTDAMDTSTETESTIVSAAAKIQAGARGFLTRRRLRRASAGTKSSTQETKASFGNDAISESLERFIEEEAAKKIQYAYRLHSKKPKNQAQSLIHSSSLESTLAAKRQTLQRGDALQNDSNSTPEDENTDCTTDVHPKKDSGIISSPNIGTRSTRRADMRINWPVLRQNSMPVQIECEVLRVIPKHKRRRIRSAQDKNKKN